MSIGKNGFWNDNKLLSFKKRHNAALTFRGPGKSYGRKFHIMNRALFHDETTLCLYRKAQDLKFAKDSWISPLINPDPEDKQHAGYDVKKFKFTGDKYLSHLYYNKKPVATFMTLESVNSIKQMYFNPNTCWVWMDEFIPLKYIKLAGIPNEGDAYQNIVDTIDHKYKDNRQDYGLPDIRCILYGNPVNGMSPLVEYFGIDPFKYGIYHPKKDVVIEHVLPGKKQAKDPNCLKDVRNFRLSYDKLAFVKNIPKGARPFQSIRIGEEQHYYTFYKSGDEFYIEQSDKHKTELKFGILIDRKPDELPFNTGFNEMCTMLQNQAIACSNYYDTYTTKVNYLNDIMHPGV